MKTINYKALVTPKTPRGVDAQKQHSKDDVQVVHMPLNPGQS